MREKLPFFALSLVFAGLALWAGRYESATFTPLEGHGVAARFVQAGYALSFYVCRTLWPAHLLPLYELPVPFDPFEARWIVPAIAAAVGTLALCLLRARLRGLWIGWLCFLILLAPFSGLAQAGPQLVADRYSYLACMPFALLAAGGLLTWIERAPAQRITAFQLAGGLALLLSISTWRQARIWHDSDTLWSHTLLSDPLQATAYQNLGVVRMRQGTQASAPGERARLWGQALGLFERGFELSPRPRFLLNQGLVHMLFSDLDPTHGRERLERARDLVERGMELQAAQPEGLSPPWELQYGILLLKLGKNDESAARLADFVRQCPDDPEGRRMLGIALTHLGRTQEALEHLEHAVQLEPQDATLWIRLGLASKELGRVPQAKAQFERALELRRQALGPAARSDPDFLEAEHQLEQLADPP